MGVFNSLIGYALFYKCSTINILDKNGLLDCMTDGPGIEIYEIIGFLF